MENLFLLSRIFCGISFVFYNYIGLHYVEVVLSTVKLSKPIRLLMAIINTIAYLTFSSSGLSIYIVYLLGYLMLISELIFIYRLTVRRVIYVASTFMFNIVAVRNVVIALIALITFQPINQISGDSALYNFSLTISFLILDIIMLLFIKEKFVTFEDLTLFSKAKIQEIYASILSFLIFAYVMFFSSTKILGTEHVNFIILNFLTSITLSMLYYVFFSYSIKMSKMFDIERRSRLLESELKETVESKLKLENIAYTDPLTNTYSRRYCIEKMNSFLQEEVEFSLCFIDVDRLKIVNDTYGHTEGDIYLQAVANILLTTLRHSDIISRMGGDEFAILFPNCTKKSTEKRMKDAHEQIKKIKTMKNLQYDTNISYGIIEIDNDNNKSVVQLLSQVDKLMYKFKQRQKNIN